MKVRVIAVLAFLFAALMVPATASASVDHFQFRGDSAFATFSSLDPNNSCIRVAADVFVSEGVQKGGPGQPETVSQLFLQLVRFNECENQPLVNAFGPPTLSAEAFQVDKLNSATLHATVQVCDEVSGTCEPAEIHLTWTGSGDVLHDQFNFHSEPGSCKMHSHGTSKSRAAVATGSITAFGMNFAVAPSLVAQIASVKQGSIVINCP